jgi:hypothetical protein
MEPVDMPGKKTPKAKSKSQRRMMGIANAIQQGKMPAAKSPAAAEIAGSMNPGDLNALASTPETGLPGRAKPSSRLRPRPGERKPMQVKSTVRHIRKF